MCTEARVIRDGETTQCATVAELAAALDVPLTTVSDDPGGFCLCNANWHALGARRATRDEGWPFTEYVIVV